MAASVPILATALMISGYGMRDVAALMLTASLVVCGLLLDTGTLVGVAVLTAACAAGMNAVEAYGLLPRAPGPFPWLRQSLDAAIIVGVTALGVRLIAERLRRSYEALRRDQAALRRSEERYRSLIELAADAICIRAEDGTILEANGRACELTGYARDELIGRTARVALRALRSAASPFDGTRAGRAARSWSPSTPLSRRDGSTVPVEISSRRMPDGTLPVHPARRQRAAPRRGRSARARGPSAAVAEDGGDRPPGRRRRPRLQQPADGDHRQPDARDARRAERRAGVPLAARGGQRRLAGGRADAPAARLRPRAGERSAARRPADGRRGHPADARAVDRRGRRAADDAAQRTAASRSWTRGRSSRCC